jgi:hypothetical protein
VLKAVVAHRARTASARSILLPVTGEPASIRIAVFTGTANQDRRGEVKVAFNASPAIERLRILRAGSGIWAGR